MSKKIIISLLVGVWACIGTNAWADQWQYWDYDDISISVNLFSTASEATCTEDTDCVDDELFCTGEPATQFCQDIDDITGEGVCTYEGDPCEGTDKPFCIEDDSKCVECLVNNNCGTGEICTNNVCVPDVPAPACEEDEDCDDDGLFCTGDPVCTDNECGFTGDPCEGTDLPVCDEDNEECVECLKDNDCADDEICDEGVCVDDAECVDDEDCDDGVCVDGVCVECRVAADCDDGLFCTGDPVCTDGECGFTGDPCAGTDEPFCIEAIRDCAECRNDDDCDIGEFCSEGECLTECTLSIVPTKARSGLIINRLRVFQITCVKGVESFNPLAGVEFADGNWSVVLRAPSGRSVLVIVSVPPALQSGEVIPVRVGICEGEITVR